MCGIIGYAGDKPAVPILLEGLRRLEYRGYDSAGIAVMDRNGDLRVSKAAGKLETLAGALAIAPLTGTLGMGHTRWATHGKPSDINAHPHTDCSGSLVVIHNGIVENFLPLKEELLAREHTFQSETDTEVISHLIETHLTAGCALDEATRQAIARIQGAHAIVAMAKGDPECLVAARVGNAGGVVVGYGEGEMFVASDLSALLPHTRRMVFLSDGEVATVTRQGASYTDAAGRPLEKTPQAVPYDAVAAAKGPYRHFMQKEITEQPEAVLDTIRGRVQFHPPGVELEGISLSAEQLAALRRVVLVGMGTSLHAAMIGRVYMERLAGLPAEVDNASEFRYRDPILGPDTLVLSVSQSGETVDTLAAMEEARRKGAPQVTVCNVVGAQSTRLAQGVVYTRCGLEIGVASTKTFSASVVALYLLALYLGQRRGLLATSQLAERLQDLARMPQLVGRALSVEPECQRLGQHLSRSRNFLFLGRGISYPVALEGALKLKEISYIHAEGYPAGEMKHGPIALIDYELPVVAIAPRDEVSGKMLANIEQVKARDGIVVAVGSAEDPELRSKVDRLLAVPEAPPLLSPLVTVVPCQLLAYHVAVRLGHDVDQPRNLAKTVTVE